MTLVQTRTDAELLRLVQDELEWNARIEATEITARVRNGVVTLSGFVDSYAHRIAAVDAVHQLAGVQDVVDDLELHSRRQAKADEEIARAIRAALAWDAWVPDEGIRSTVSNGWVTLEGSVENGHQREDALRAVERLLGVRGVTNKIAIDGPAITASGIRSSIEKALTRRAAREAKHLSIDVREGVVTLKGTVDSWAERNAVERLASYTPGVKRLVNEITVDAYQ
jgi:osmotically-inducible protein OsmY